MELFVVLAIPAILLIGSVFLLANGNGQLRAKLLRIGTGGPLSQAWNFGVIFMAVVSIIVYVARR